jgi:hypothetical protein
VTFQACALGAVTSTGIVPGRAPFQRKSASDNTAEGEPKGPPSADKRQLPPSLEQLEQLEQPASAEQLEQLEQPASPSPSPASPPSSIGQAARLPVIAIAPANRLAFRTLFTPFFMSLS